MTVTATATIQPLMTVQTMYRFLVSLFGLVLSVTAFAQQPPYGEPPEVRPPYYRVRYEGSSEPGQCIFPVSYTAWIPPGVSTLRGIIVHQHGCGEGSCKSGQTGAFDLHWQALAAKHHCALIAPSYEQPQDADCQMWCDPRNGSDATFQRALVELGKLTDHPEMARVPWALWGHSGGGHWAGGMLLLHPDRIAAVWLRSGVPLFEPIEGRKIKPHVLVDGALRVPVMCNLGTKEGFSVTEGRFAGVWSSNKQFFQTMRQRGALIAIAVDPLSSHECGHQRYLAIPWFDACLSMRLGETSEMPLRAIDESNGTIVQWDDATAAITPDTLWMPSDSLVERWMQYINDASVIDLTAPPSPTNVRLEGDQLTWEAVADLESGIAQFVIQRDGKTVATVPEQPRRTFGRPVFQGLQYSDTPLMPLSEMRCTVEPVGPNEPNPYRVRSVNTAGLLSEAR